MDSTQPLQATKWMAKVSLLRGKCMWFGILYLNEKYNVVECSVHNVYIEDLD